MITIRNWDKLTEMFRSKVEVEELEIHYLIKYYYPTLSTGDFYYVTLSKMNPPQQNHPHKKEYLLLCGDEHRWMSRIQLEDINIVYDAIIGVVAEHDLKVTPN